LPRRLRAVALALLLPFTATVLLAGCSSNSNRGVTGSVGVGSGVALTTPGSVTQLLAGATLVVSAIVTNDVNNAGVTWSLTGDLPGQYGTLSDITTSQVTYNSYTDAVGAVSATITAVSKADPSNYAAVTLVVFGTPVMSRTPLFPANLNVGYAGSLSVAGGEADYTWTLLSGSLPTGLILNGSTGSSTTVSGTPTETGTFTFTVQATDALGRTTQGTFTLVVTAQAACLLQGQYSLYFTGFRGGGAATHVANVLIDSTTGAITGEQDYKDGHRTTTGETLTSGTCANHSTNTGTITLVAPSGTTEYEFAATVPNASNILPSARLQLIGSGSDSGSGFMTLQDTAAYSAGSALPAAGYAFGVLGAANQEPLTVHFGTIGGFTTDGSGNLHAGLIDSNNPSATLSDATLTGSMSAPDAYGRGTLALASGASSSTLVYYIVNANKMFLMDIDSTVGSARMSGFLTTQSGDLPGGGFDNNALMVSPSIISLWGAQGSTEPISVAELGRLGDGNAAAGTFDAELDMSVQTVETAPAGFIAQPYAVSSNGRGTMSLTSTSAVRNFVYYLDGISDGYIIETGSTTGNAGFLEAQYSPPVASDGTTPYPDTFATFYAGGTQFPQAAGPVILMPLVSLNDGTLTSTYTTGTFAINPVDGRGLGTMTDTGVGEADAVIYVVTPDKLDVLRFSYRSIDASLEWFTDD
jgi:hypothetical protein